MPEPTRRRARSGLVATLAAGTLLLAGCSSSPTSAPDTSTPTPAPTSTGSPATTPSPAALSWTGSVCDALNPLVSTLKAPPAPDLGNPAATQQAYRTYLDAAITQTDQARQQVSVAGAPPVPGDDQVGRRVQDQLDQLRTDLTQARSQVDGANDPASISQAVGVAGNVLGALGNTAQALAAVSDDAQLDGAFAQSPSCDPLRAISRPS